MSFVTILIINLAVVMILAAMVWLISLPLRDVSIVDIFWGLGFVVIAWVTLLLAEPRTTHSWLTAVLTAVWGLRLSGYLAWRNLGHGEDRRYRELRRKIGLRFPWLSLFVVFWLQAALMCIISLPVQAGVTASAEPLLHWQIAGGVLWLIGLVFESVGDWQLARFKANPDNEGQVLDRGLWRYTRHPNYFGEFLVWWGFYLLAVSVGAWWTLPGPLVISFLLLRVSGVTLLEKSMNQRRPAYADYIRRTSPFFPWPPRNASHA
jgi:steroid 5-alpha reductase family enzyme